MTATRQDMMTDTALEMLVMVKINARLHQDRTINMAKVQDHTKIIQTNVSFLFAQNFFFCSNYTLFCNLLLVSAIRQQRSSTLHPGLQPRPSDRQAQQQASEALNAHNTLPPQRPQPPQPPTHNALSPNPHNPEKKKKKVSLFFSLKSLTNVFVSNKSLVYFFFSGPEPNVYEQWDRRKKEREAADAEKKKAEKKKLKMMRIKKKLEMMRIKKKKRKEKEKEKCNEIDE